jgi:predicted DNA-binding transcriptional regulator YafY
MDRALDSLWSKLASPTLEATAGSQISAFTSIDYAPHRKTIELLEMAVHDRHVVSLRYHRTNGEDTRRDFEPHALHADAAVEGLYVIGHCRLRRAVRTLAVHRISHCRDTGEVFRERADLRTKAQLQSAFRAWMSDHPMTKVELRFSASAAAEISERRYHSSQINTPLEDGSLGVTLSVPEPAALIRWLLGFASDVEVLSPLELRTEICNRHRAAAGLESPEGIDITSNSPISGSESTPALRRAPEVPRLETVPPPGTRRDDPDETT